METSFLSKTSVSGVNERKERKEAPRKVLTDSNPGHKKSFDNERVDTK